MKCQLGQHVIEIVTIGEKYEAFYCGNYFHIYLNVNIDYFILIHVHIQFIIVSNQKEYYFIGSYLFWLNNIQ